MIKITVEDGNGTFECFVENFTVTHNFHVQEFSPNGQNHLTKYVGKKDYTIDSMQIVPVDGNYGVWKDEVKVSWLRKLGRFLWC